MSPLGILLLCVLAPLVAYVTGWLFIDWWMDRRAGAGLPDLHDYWESYASKYRGTAKAPLTYPVRGTLLLCPDCGYEDGQPIGPCPGCDA